MTNSLGFLSTFREVDIYIPKEASFLSTIYQIQHLILNKKFHYFKSNFLEPKCLINLMPTSRSNLKNFQLIKEPNTALAASCSRPLEIFID